MAIAEYFAALNIKTKGALSSLDKFNAKAESVASKTEDIGKSFSKKVTLPIIGGFALAIKGAGNLEAGLIGVQKTTGLTDEAITGLKRSFLDFGSANSVSVDSLVETAKVAGQLGLSGADEINKFTQTFAKLEIASDRTVSGELGATAFAKFIDLSGESIDSAEGIASSITALGNTSKTNEGRILSTAEEIVKGTARFKLGAANILGIATAFDEIGVEAEVSGSTLQRFFNNLDIAVKGNTKELGVFSKTIGVSNKELVDLQASDPSKVFELFLKGIQELNADGKDTATLLKDLGLGEIRSSGAIQALAANYQKVTEKIKLASDAQIENTALQNEADAANRGFNASFVRLSNSLVSLGDAVASTGLLDLLTGLITNVSGFVAMAAQASPEAIEMGIAIAAVAASIGPVTTIFGKLIGIIPKLLGPWGLLIGAALFLADVFDISIIDSFRRIRDWLKDILPNLVDSLKSKFSEFARSIKSKFEGIGSFFGFGASDAIATKTNNFTQPPNVSTVSSLREGSKTLNQNIEVKTTDPIKVADRVVGLTNLEFAAP